MRRSWRPRVAVARAQILFRPTGFTSGPSYMGCVSPSLAPPPVAVDGPAAVSGDELVAPFDSVVGPFPMLDLSFLFMGPRLGRHRKRNF